MNKIKVVVVDDSALMRKIISDMINSQDDMEVINTAKNGDELLKKLSPMPDVITLDVEMPVVNGIETLSILQQSHIQVPVIMLSSLTKSGADITMECLQLGAFDFISKPSGSISLDINKVKDELIDKIREAKNSRRFIPANWSPKEKEIPLVQSFGKSPKVVNKSKNIKAILIGASTGGPKALFQVITNLPKLDIPIFVVQHMPVGFTKSFAERLNNNSKMSVVEAENNMAIEKNTVYIAKAGYHLKLSQGNRLKLDESEPIWGVRPAVDKLFFSAVEVYNSNLLSLILTGMGRDGAEGTAVVKDGGGITLCQDERSSTVYGMPKAAFATGKVDEVVSLDNAAKRITEIVMKRGV